MATSSRRHCFFPPSFRRILTSLNSDDGAGAGKTSLLSEMDMCFFMTFVAKVFLSLLRVIKTTLPNMPSPNFRPSSKSSWSRFVLS